MTTWTGTPIEAKTLIADLKEKGWVIEGRGGFGEFFTWTLAQGVDRMEVKVSWSDLMSCGL